MKYMILGPDDPALAVLKQQLADHPEWDAELKIVPWADYQGMMNTSLAAEQSPYQAVCVPGHIWLPGLVADGKLEAFENLLPGIAVEVIQEYDLADIIPAVHAESLMEGKQYLLPLFTDGHLIFYRKDLLDFTHVPEGILDPRSIPELLEMLTLPAGHYPMALKAHPSEILLDWLPYLWAFGGELVDDNHQPAFNSSAAIRALEFFIDLKRFCPPDTHLYGNAEILNILQQGKAALAVSWGGQAAPILDDSNPYRNEIGTTTFTQPWNTTWGVSIPTNQPKAVKQEMLSVLYTAADKQQDREVARLAGSPVRLRSYSFEEMERYTWLQAQKEMLERRQLLPIHPDFSKYLGPLYAMVYAAFTGELTASEGLNQAAKT
ncbi:MAG: hypothetical protein FD166_3716 [Bacteroidetes bacterium]|nr:MAG: hypothetical protein FD166_3716 [Bacteroidota bacterium]